MSLGPSLPLLNYCEIPGSRYRIFRNILYDPLLQNPFSVEMAKSYSIMVSSIAAPPFQISHFERAEETCAINVGRVYSE